MRTLIEKMQKFFYHLIMREEVENLIRTRMMESSRGRRKPKVAEEGEDQKSQKKEKTKSCKGRKRPKVAEEGEE